MFSLKKICKSEHQAIFLNIFQVLLCQGDQRQMGEFQSGLYLQITEIVGAIVNLVDGELKNVTPSALQWNAALSPIRVRSRCKA